MADKKKIGMIMHGIGTKYHPAFFQLMLFVFMSPWTGYFRQVDPAIAFATYAFAAGGASFLYEGLVVFPTKGKIGGIGTAGMLFILAIVDFVFAAMTYTGGFNPFIGGSDLIIIASFVTALSAGLLFVLGTGEVFLSKRSSKILAEAEKKLTGHS